MSDVLSFHVFPNVFYTTANTTNQMTITKPTNELVIINIVIIIINSLITSIKIDTIII